MECVALEQIRNRRRGLGPRSVALLLSIAVHAAAVPLIGAAFVTHDPAPVEPPVIEVTLAWMPPPAQEEVPPAAVSTPPPPEPPAAEAPPPAAPANPAPAVPRPPKVHAAVHPRPAPAREKPQPEAIAAPTPEAAPAAPETAPAASPPPPQVSAAPPPVQADVLARYSRAVLERLERQKTYPILSQRRGEEGTVVVHLTVSEDGRLLDVEPQGNGPERLIEASLAAVRAAAPFPPLPPELGAHQVAFNLPIVYRLR